MRELMVRDLLGAVDQMFNLESYHRSFGDMRVDIKEHADKYVLMADLPGVEKENIKLKFEDASLTIEIASKREAEKKEGERVLRLERYSAIKSRSFYFNDKIKEDEIKAQYKDGVLTLEVPKYKPEVSIREIKID